MYHGHMDYLFIHTYMYSSIVIYWRVPEICCFSRKKEIEQRKMSNSPDKIPTSSLISQTYRAMKII